MVLCMRTTLDLNDALLIQAKDRAARERRTLTAFVEEALRAQLSGRPARTGPLPKIPVIPGGIPQPGIDFTSNSSLLDAMEEDGNPGR
jgi:hypothetical protein